MTFLEFNLISTVPFPFVQPDVEACLIVKDNEWKQKMKEKNVQAKIMTYQKLRDDHDSHEAKKKLVNSYDMFLCDHNMMRLVMNWLGDIAVKAKRFVFSTSFVFTFL